MKKKLFALLLIAGLSLGAAQGYAAIQPYAETGAASNCPGLNGQFDKQAFVEALKNCPGLNGSLDRQAFAEVMAEAAQKCPYLNGKMDPNGFAQAFVKAAEKCPGLKGKVTPEVLAMAVRYCPWVRGKIDAAALAAAAQKCPGLQRMGVVADKPGQPNAAPVVAEVDARMRAIVKALENNKRSADSLIAAAKEAGANPELVAEMDKMSQAFRQFFMNTVSPQQIIESILAAPKEPDGHAGLIITAPDGTTWLVSPQMTQPMPPRKGGPRPPRPEAPRPPVMGAPDMSGMPGIQLPPPGVLQSPDFRMQPQAQPEQPQASTEPKQPTPPVPGVQQGMPAQVAPKMIIMEESDMPLWPTREQLGKDGVLRYLEKRVEKGAMGQ